MPLGESQGDENKLGFELPFGPDIDLPPPSPAEPAGPPRGTSLANAASLPQTPGRARAAGAARAVLQALIVLGLLALGLYMAHSARTTGPDAADTGSPAFTAAPAPPPAAEPFPEPAAVPPPPTVLRLACGREKEAWLQAALRQFGQTEACHGIEIDLVAMDPAEAIDSIVNGESRLHAWSPASSISRSRLEHRWRAQREGEPIGRSESIALTPLVYAMWRQRYEPFVAHYGKVTLETIGKALAERGGWGVIADRPRWGRFRFAHAHPARSSSGAMMALLMASAWADKTEGLVPGDLTDPCFVAWAQSFEKAVAERPSSATETMRQMIRLGPDLCDAALVWEAAALEHIASAQDRWGPVQVIYPERNFWADNPYCILDVPWSSKDQRRAARAFLDFLLSPPGQRLALQHGFRPVDVKVPLQADDSPFTRHRACGVTVELSGICPLPDPAVLEVLLDGDPLSSEGGDRSN